MNILFTSGKLLYNFCLLQRMRKWHRGNVPSPGGNLPSNRYLTRHFYSFMQLSGTHDAAVLNWQGHICLPLRYLLAIIVLLFSKIARGFSIFFTDFLSMDDIFQAQAHNTAAGSCKFARFGCIIKKNALEDFL